MFPLLFSNQMLIGNDLFFEKQNLIFVVFCHRRSSISCISMRDAAVSVSGRRHMIDPADRISKPCRTNKKGRVLDHYVIFVISAQLFIQFHPVARSGRRYRILCRHPLIHFLRRADADKTARLLIRHIRCNLSKIFRAHGNRSRQHLTSLASLFKFTHKRLDHMLVIERIVRRKNHKITAMRMSGRKIAVFYRTGVLCLRIDFKILYICSLMLSNILFIYAAVKSWRTVVGQNDFYLWINGIERFVQIIILVIGD